MKTGFILRIFLLLAPSLFFASHALAATRTLTINTNGNGAVSRNPNLVTYPESSVVTLTAQPASGWQFSSWSGDASSTSNPLNVTMDADKLLTANFSAIPTFTLSVSASGGGSVSPPGGTYLSNTVVSLTASPSNGWIFYRWMGSENGSANPLNVNMNTNKVVTAIFGQPPAITSQPTGAVVSAGTSVSFSAGVSGSAPLNFQWLWNGAVLSNATATTLTFNSAQSSQAGDYRLIASNLYGSATSQVATLIVTCTGTNVVTDCSDAALRQAITAGGNVRLCCNGNIALTNTITISKHVTLDAAGQSVTLDGGGNLRLFSVLNGVTLQITNVFLANGRHTGVSGGIGRGAAIENNGGTVRLVSCVLSNHHAVGGSGTNVGGDAGGGAIYNGFGTVALNGCLVVSNSAIGGPGSTKGAARGGAIWSQDGSVYLNDCDVAGNRTFSDIGTAPSFSAGGALFADGANLFATNSTFSGNRAVTVSDIVGNLSPAAVYGGALYLQLSVPNLYGFVTLDSVRLVANSAAGEYARNAAPSPARGGAIYNSSRLQAVSCAIVSNNASAGGGVQAAQAQGGGVFNSGSLIFSGVTVENNAARSGDGRNTGLSGFAGADAFGGGVCNRGTMYSTNSTFALNRSIGGNRGGGGIAAGNGFGGGIFDEGVDAVLMNSTLASNLAVGGGNLGGPGGFALGANLAVTNGLLSLRNSLLAGLSNNAWGAYADGGFNISSDGSAAFNRGTSFNFTDPKLGPLANNGGASRTMALLPGSPAIDYVNATGAPSTDQRGAPRPYGAGVDVGAFEAGPLIPPLALKRVAGATQVSFVGQAGISYRIEYSPDLANWFLQEDTGVLPVGGIVTRTNQLNHSRQFFRLSWDWNP